MNKDAGILVVGHDAWVEKGFLSVLEGAGFSRVFGSRNMALDASVQAAVYDFFQSHRPAYVFLGSGSVWPIKDKESSSADSLERVFATCLNVASAARKFGAAGIVFVGNAFMDPRGGQGSVRKEPLLSATDLSVGTPEIWAGILGWRLLAAYREQYGFRSVTAVPAALYGVYEAEEARPVSPLGRMIEQCLSAKQSGASTVETGLNGDARFDFLDVEDWVRACLILADRREDHRPVYVGPGREISFREMGGRIREATGFDGELIFHDPPVTEADSCFPESVTTSIPGWRPEVDLPTGIRQMVGAFQHREQTAGR